MKTIKKLITHSLCILLSAVLFSCKSDLDTWYTHEGTVLYCVESDTSKGFVLSQKKSIISRRYLDANRNEIHFLGHGTTVIQTSDWYSR